MSQRSKRFKNQKKMHLSIQLPNSLEGSGARCFRAKKCVFGFSRQAFKEATVHNWGRFSQDFSSFKWSLIGHLLKKTCGRPIGKIIFPQVFQCRKFQQRRLQLKPPTTNVSIKHVPSLNRVSLLKARGISQSDATKGLPSRSSNTQIYMLFAWYLLP